MSSLQLTQIDHVSVIITEIDRSRRFYGQVLGLKEIFKPKSFDFIALWFELGNQQLHLLQKPQPDSRSPRHFALRVKDIEAARDYFRRLGITPEETTKINQCDRFFVYDPDSNRIEIIEWLQPYDPIESGASQFDD